MKVSWQVIYFSEFQSLYVLGLTAHDKAIRLLTLRQTFPDPSALVNYDFNPKRLNLSQSKLSYGLQNMSFIHFDVTCRLNRLIFVQLNVFGLDFTTFMSKIAPATVSTHQYLLIMIG